MAGVSERPCARKPRGAEQRRRRRSRARYASRGSVRQGCGAASPAAPGAAISCAISGAKRPAHDHEIGQQCGERHRGGRGVGAPGDGKRGDDERGEHRERRRIVPAGQHQDQRGDERTPKARSRTSGRSGRGRRRAIEQVRDDQCGDQRKAHHDVEQMRGQRFDLVGADARQHPEQPEGHRDERKPRPQPHARQRERRRRHHREIDVERPVVRLGRTATSSGVT